LPAIPGPTLPTETLTRQPPLTTSTPTTRASALPEDCITPIEEFSQEPAAKGKIVLSGILHFSGAPLTSPSYLLALASGERVLLPQQDNKVIVDESFAISPNREWLEYAQVNPNVDEPSDETLHFVTKDGFESKVISIGIHQRESLWINDSHLLIENLRQNWSAPEAKATLLIINPFTEDRKELFNNYPNQWNGDNLEWNFTLSRVIYNPTLSRVIYPTFVTPDRVIRLVNVETNEIVADIPTTDYGKFPAWSSDGKQIAFATQINKDADWDSHQDEIFLLKEDGNLVQLTHVSKANNFAYITGLSWSVDNRYIAFWVNNTNWEEGRTGIRLAIVDTTTGNIREFCKIGNLDGLIYLVEGEDPLWSPNDKYLAVNLVDPNNEQYTLVVLVEISTGRLFQVAENYRAVGWLK
jgi:dipeptidyl aminopeptidase/acylaminoacyl peptidase